MLALKQMLFQRSCTMVEMAVAVWAVKGVAMMRGACTIDKLDTCFDSHFLAGTAQSPLSARLYKLRPVSPATLAIDIAGFNVPATPYRVG